MFTRAISQEEKRRRNWLRYRRSIIIIISIIIRDAATAKCRFCSSRLEHCFECANNCAHCWYFRLFSSEFYGNTFLNKEKRNIRCSRVFTPWSKRDKKSIEEISLTCRRSVLSRRRNESFTLSLFLSKYKGKEYLQDFPDDQLGVIVLFHFLTIEMKILENLVI